jgi:pantetheine-phosphate adenylyltransferase
MVHESLGLLEGVDVRSFEGLVVDFCREVHANVLVRGLRTVSDFEAEFQQAALNRQMLPGLEVVCLFASPEYSVLSSSMIKEIAESGGDVSSMVPSAVLRRLARRAAQPSASLARGG